MGLQSNELRLRYVQWTGNLVCAISIIEKKHRLIEQIRGPEILNCLSCLGRYFISDWFLSSSKCHTRCIREMKGLTAEPVNSSFSSVSWACQILERVKQEKDQVLKATYGYMESEKVNISCLEIKLCFQKDTYDQSCTTAWRAKHFPASSCSFVQNLGHPKSKIKTFSITSGRKTQNYTLQ